MKLLLRLEREFGEAEKGLLPLPRYVIASQLGDHLFNAVTEYGALLENSIEAYERLAKDILDAYRSDDRDTLLALLQGEDATIYDNTSRRVILGCRPDGHMRAYSGTYGWVNLRKGSDKHTPVYVVPNANDPLVVLTKYTKIFLDDKILGRIGGVAGRARVLRLRLTMVNGVPGCGKTTWITKNFRRFEDLIITTTREAAADVRTRLSLDENDSFFVRTAASLLANGLHVRASDRAFKPKRLLFDEALMRHFGAVVSVAVLAGVTDVCLVGDRNQIPFIDRLNLFPLHYSTPEGLCAAGENLICTHRNPLDVAYVLRKHYDGVYASRRVVRSFRLHAFSGTSIPSNLENTLYLVHDQTSKDNLRSHSFGTAPGSALLTIHEAQGLAYDHVVILRTTPKPLKIFSSVPHAIVGISRHRLSCTYYTDAEDEVSRLVRDALSATEQEILTYSIVSSLVA